MVAVDVDVNAVVVDVGVVEESQPVLESRPAAVVVVDEVR